MQFIRSLHSIRGYCALWIAFGHYHFLIDQVDPIYGKQIFRYFMMGITIFFILSGFFLSYIYHEKFTSFRNIKNNFIGFIIYRLGRVYPLYLTVLLSFAAMSYLGWTRESSIAENNQFETAFYFPLYLLMMQCWGFLEGREQFAFNPPSWTLSVDFLFYLIFPFIFVVIAKLKNISVNLGIIIATYIYYYLSVHDLGVVDTSNNTKMYFLASFENNPIEILPLFIVGICIYNLQSQNFLKSIKWDLVIIISIIATIFMMINDYSLNAILLITPILLYSLLNISDKFDRYFSNPVSYYMGRLAYSIYLWHIPYAIFVNHFYPLKNADIWGIFFIPLACGLIILSSLSYHFIENPCRIWIKKNLSS